MFAEALTPSTVVWEWGSGSSSLYFSQCVANWTSIEHSMGWCRYEFYQLAYIFFLGVRILGLCLGFGLRVWGLGFGCKV